MTASEQIWFVVGIGGFLVFMEGAITFIVNLIAERFKKRIRAEVVRIVVGIVIFVIALVYLFNLPST
jgi:uncharacterized membrane protein YfcA